MPHQQPEFPECSSILPACLFQRDAKAGLNPWYPREQWDPFDPMLLSEGAFAAGMIFSFLKLVHIFSGDLRNFHTLPPLHPL